MCRQVTPKFTKSSIRSARPVPEEALPDDATPRIWSFWPFSACLSFCNISLCRSFCYFLIYLQRAYFQTTHFIPWLEATPESTPDSVETMNRQMNNAWVIVMVNLKLASWAAVGCLLCYFFKHRHQVPFLLRKVSHYVTLAPSCLIKMVRSFVTGFVAAFTEGFSAGLAAGYSRNSITNTK